MCQSNKVHDAFDCFKASEELKSITKDFLRTARQREVRRRRRRTAIRPAFGYAFGMACFLLVFALGAGTHALLGKTVSYVSIDVNPSIELGLNRLDRVVSAKGYNEDGEAVLDALSLRGMLYTDAVNAVVGSEAMQPYLSEDAGLTFTVAADSGQKETALLIGIESSAVCREHGGVSFGADIGSVEEAHESGLSLGKYAAYQILSRYDGTITAQDCRDMTMAEIHNLIGCHEHARDGCGGHDSHDTDAGTDG